MPSIYIINGPNLNLLGERQPTIYGDQTFESFFEALKQKYSQIQLVYYQSNHEGQIIDQLHKIRYSATGIILNAAAFTHTSIAIADAVAQLKMPVIEVHISNVHARENFRSKSYLSPYVQGIISGLGLDGYRLALEYLLNAD